MDMNGYLRINTSKELDWQKGYERINQKDKSHKISLHIHVLIQLTYSDVWIGGCNVTI